MESKIVDSPEFTAMLEKIPTHIFLTMGVHKIQRGDEFMPPESYGERKPVVHENEFGLTYDRHSCLCRRPITEPIRRNAAFWALYEKYRYVFYKGDKVKIASTCTQDNGVMVCTENSWMLYPDQIEALGGCDEIDKHLSSGCLLPKWMAGEI